MVDNTLIFLFHRLHTIIKDEHQTTSATQADHASDTEKEEYLQY